MKLSDLTAYAEEKYHICEDHKWADFPGFSVLADPDTGKWVALLMRQWDAETGTEIERCDIKCGRESLYEFSSPSLTLPFRMKGRKWIGVVMGSETDPALVFRLFDRALSSGEQRGYTIVLDNLPQTETTAYRETPLSFGAAPTEFRDPVVPVQILRMADLYEYGDGSCEQRNQNFFRQGKFMEDYEDDAPWIGDFSRYFPTYHDLNIRQLRGYFTWRSRVRRGEYAPTAASFPYIYLYELLCGIGTRSPEESLKKMQEFERGFLDLGFGGAGMRKNLRRWMLEYAILHGLPPEEARAYADPALLEKDNALAALKDPGAYSDREIFEALCFFGGKKLLQSPVVTEKRERGERLFAALWRYMTQRVVSEGKNIFTLCFGTPLAYFWRPLSNAVYWEERRETDTVYALDPCRSYSCKGGVWQEERYENLYFDLNRLTALLHEADRQFRKYLKTGRALRQKPEGAWAAPLIETVIEADRRAAAEAARPKITIDLSALDRIRCNAELTRESLLTEEEREDGEIETSTVETEAKPAEEAAPSISTLFGLDAFQTGILLTLLRGESPDAHIRELRLMPTVLADSINEALFDLIGDSVLICDGAELRLAEDYREDLAQLLEGQN